MSAVASVQPPVTVLLDQAEAVTNRQCRNAIAEFALRLPPGWQLVLASRTAAPLPTARLRAQGDILEVTADDLTMGTAEAHSLLREAGVESDEGSLRDLLQRTEGWPAGLYIAALAIKSGTRHSDVGFAFTGNDVYMGDYLRSELLDRISDAEASFLTRTSVLNRMCGPLCDAILGEQGSGHVLEQMEARNLLVVPLDRRREWYRYHHLLRELLQAELQRREPGLVQDLHFRAAAWLEANAMPEAAIDHAQAAGDYDRVARLILELQQRVWASGRVETVRRWMEWLRDVTSAEYYGAIAAHGSLIFALLGQPGEAERWAAAAERASPAGILPDGSTIEATLAYLRAILCRSGTSEMRRDARIACAGLSPASPYRATMLYTEGISHLLEGDPVRAEPIFAQALELATHSGSLPLAGLILAQQCNLAAQRNFWPEVTSLAQRAVTIARAGHLDDYWSSGLVYAWAARAALHQGNVSQGRSYLGRASRLRPLLTYMLPVVSVQALLEMAYSCWRRGGPDASRPHPPAKARPRHPGEAGRRTAGHTRHDQGGRRRPVGTHRGRAAAPAAVADAPFGPGDRRPVVRLAAHHQVASDVHLPQAGCHHPHPSGYPSPGARAPGGLTDSGMTDIDPTSDIELHAADEHVIVRVPLAGPVTEEWLRRYQRLARATGVPVQTQAHPGRT